MSVLELSIEELNRHFKSAAIETPPMSKQEMQELAVGVLKNRDEFNEATINWAMTIRANKSYEDACYQMINDGQAYRYAS